MVVGRQSPGTSVEWDTVREGCYLLHRIFGKRGAIEATSIYSQLIGRVQEVSPDIREYGSPKEAKIWEALEFQMKRQKVRLAVLADGEVDMLMPTAFLGKQ